MSEKTNPEYSEQRGYNVGIAQEVGIDAACVYNQLAFWQRIKGRGEFFYKSYADMQLEVPLTEYQLRKAYSALRKARLIETKLLKANGAPTLHFRLLKNLRMDTEKTAETMDTEKTAETINNKLPIKNIHRDPETPKNVEFIYQLYLTRFKCTGYEHSSKTERAELLARAKKRYKLTPPRREAIVRRLDDAGLNMLHAAIIGYARDPWYQGQNNSGWTADLVKFICRSYEKVEEGANKYEQQKAGTNTNDPWANL